MKKYFLLLALVGGPFYNTQAGEYLDSFGTGAKLVGVTGTSALIPPFSALIFLSGCNMIVNRFMSTVEGSVALKDVVLLVTSMGTTAALEKARDQLIKTTPNDEGTAIACGHLGSSIGGMAVIYYFLKLE